MEAHPFRIPHPPFCYDDPVQVFRYKWTHHSPLICDSPAETMLFGVLLVTVGHCLRLLLFRPGQPALKNRREIKWWAVGVTVCMFAVSALDLALNFIVNLETFPFTWNRQSVLDTVPQTTEWINVLRYALFLVLVFIADGVLVYRLFVVYGQRWLFKVILVGLLFALCGGGAIFLIVFVTGHGFLGTIPRSTEIALFGIDMLLNAIATSLIVRKLWMTHTGVSRISLNTNKWLILIRIIVESGLLYMLSEAAMLVSDLFGNAAVCVADAVGQTIAIASILLILRTHDMLKGTPYTRGLTVIDTNLSSTEAGRCRGYVVRPVTGARSDASLGLVTDSV